MTFLHLSLLRLHGADHVTCADHVLDHVLAGAIGALTSLYVPPLTTPGLPQLLNTVWGSEGEDPEDEDPFGGEGDPLDDAVGDRSSTDRVDAAAAMLVAALKQARWVEDPTADGMAPQGMAAVMRRAAELLEAEGTEGGNLGGNQT